MVSGEFGKGSRGDLRGFKTSCKNSRVRMNPKRCEPSPVTQPLHETKTCTSEKQKTEESQLQRSLKLSQGCHSQSGTVNSHQPPHTLGTYVLSSKPHTAGDNLILSRKRNEEANHSLRCVSDISRDPIIPISENFIFLVKLPFIFPNSHSKPFFFKIRLLFFSNGCLF